MIGAFMSWPNCCMVKQQAMNIAAVPANQINAVLDAIVFNLLAKRVVVNV